MSDDRRTCYRCARSLKRWRGEGPPSHKCGHGKRCLVVHEPDHCTLCRAVVEALLEIANPSCIFCSAGLIDRKIDCYTPSFARGGCIACGMPGGGSAGKSPHADPAFAAEVRAGMVDVFAGLRGAS